MIFRNGENLLENLNNFLSEEKDVLVFSPYIKNSKFKELLDINNCIKQVIVRWFPNDLLLGASDIEVYDTCVERGITLFRNPRLHLKAFLGLDRCFFGSTNISERAISTSEFKKFNYELATMSPRVDLNTRLYLQNILHSSSLITSDVVDQIKAYLQQVPQPYEPEEDFKIVFNPHDHFLLSSLPMSSSIDTLFEIYSSDSSIFSAEELNFAAHDLALFQIPSDLEGFVEFKRKLQTQFNGHQFIQALKRHIEEQPHKSLNYGGVVRWIQNTTTTVPTPRSWEIKQQQIVNILYDWICDLDQEYQWKRPNHSQVIFKI